VAADIRRDDLLLADQKSKASQTRLLTSDCFLLLPHDRLKQSCEAIVSESIALDAPALPHIG
jgi:hypothetical protein